MDIKKLRQKFIEYFADIGYEVVDPSSLIPENDPSVLFTTAGMQQFKDFYQHPTEAPTLAVVNIQPVIRTSDIAEVGDSTHLTCFEMLGNFRFGQKSAMTVKQIAIEEAWKFINETLEVEKDRVYATVFGGDKQTPADTQSEGIWQSLGVKIKRAGREDNFWGPTGDEGPCGPTSEIYIDGVEVWNLVFNEYYCSRDGKYVALENAGLDTGSGLERLAATLQGKTSIWEIEPFISWVEQVDPEAVFESRSIIDHLRAIIFIISAGVVPSNKGREYILRRLIRKTVFLVSKLHKSFDWEVTINYIRGFYAPIYDLKTVPVIWGEIEKEKLQFEKNLARATSYLDRWQKINPKAAEKEVTELAFYMFESFGFPKELVIEYLVSQGYSVDPKYFQDLFAKHQDISRSNLDAQFKGGLADHEPQTVKHHTAHHLLLAALRQVLGNTIVQKGSNVTSERLRIDFNFDRKLTEDELKQVEDLVNQKIQADLPVTVEQLPRDEALASGALAEFGQKYGDVVTVYTIGPSTSSGLAFSKELCGGPHVKDTGELGKFSIIKEEASSQGVRRIKAKVF